MLPEMTHSRDKKLWSQWWIILCSFVVAVQAQHRSNIVFIMVDDMGWNDVSFHGSDQILTPNIDTMAYRGIILQQYYSEPVCTPARTALLTGKYPMRLGMQGFPLYNSEDRGIPLTERLLPSYLKELGYTTHLVGKWHVGMSRKEYLPTSRGYDTHYGMRGGFIDYYTYNKVETLPNGTSLFGMDLFDNDVPQETEERYIVDALTDRAVKIIQYHNTTCPLFLHVTHNAPHAGNPGSALQPPLNSGGGIKNRHIAHSNRRLFAEVVNNIDRSVAKVVKALEDKGILDDTLIIFVSDNGAPTVGTNGNWGVNLPLRGIKYTPWEGALRVPAFMWHSSFQPRIWNGLMHISDWLPTLTAAVGGQLQAKIDGVNQWGAITKDTESKRKEVLLAVEDSNRNVYAAYRAGDYKIVVGNVTGLNNGYYGADFMRTKNGYQPDYFATLKTCKVAKIFERMGIYLDFFGVLATRAMATIKQEDPVRDRTPCLPSPSRGCLFNVRRDPTESHDLWDRASKIVVLLTSRLRGLWASQLKRGPPNIQTQADPANFNYLWTPWITCQSNATKSQKIIQFDERSLLLNFNGNRNTEAKTVNCNGTTGIKNFLCILRSYF